MATASHAFWLRYVLLAVIVSSFIDGIRPQSSSPDSFDGMDTTVRAIMVVFVVLFVLVFITAVYFTCKRFQLMNRVMRHGLPQLIIDTHGPSPQPRQPSGSRTIPSEVEGRLRKLCYTLEEVIRMTNNFSVKLGEGGFGSVYRGKLKDGRMVAVKKLSTTSAQGPTEFLNEVEILSRAHHRNLVSMIGYCCESNERCLIYEFMSNGDLHDRLHGLPSEQEPLDWPMRLKVAIGAVKGLSYLHYDCDPPIIHRDVKSSNILLDDNYVAKVADFGISKLITQQFFTHLSTRVVGTFGYLDPEYEDTQRLTEKSDVYSFGVILLELISGKRVRVHENGKHVHIVEWVTPYVLNNMIDHILDKHLGNISNKKSIQKVLDISLKCIAYKGSERPHFSEVLEVLKASLEMEYSV